MKIHIPNKACARLIYNIRDGRVEDWRAGRGKMCWNEVMCWWIW